MIKKKSPLKIISRLYKSLRKWILYGSLFLTLMIIYFGDLLGEIKNDLIPAFIVSVVAIIFEVITSLEEKVSNQENFIEFSLLSEAVPFLAKKVQENNEKTLIEIIASTGGTTISSVLPTLINNSNAKQIDISLMLINSNSPFANWFPDHWITEVEIVKNRINQLTTNNNVNINLFVYDNLPVIHGIMINKSHLVIGFFGWRHYSGRTELSGAEQTHRYYNIRDPKNEYHFDLFEDWFENSPRELLEMKDKNQSTIS